MEEQFEGCCDVCGDSHSTELCPELGLEDSDFENVVVTRARLTLPHSLQAIDLPNGEVTLYATEELKKKSQFGPFEAKKTTHEFSDDGLFVLKILTKEGVTVSLDTTEESECNWMCLVQSALDANQQNLMAYQLGTSIYYSATRDIAPGTELRVWYAPQYARRLGKSVEPDGLSKVMLGMKVIYPSVEELAESQTLKSGGASLNPTTGEIMPLESEISNHEEQGHLEDPNEDMESLNVVIANYRCKRCRQGFMTEIELGKHIREHIYPPGSGRKGRLPKGDKGTNLKMKKTNEMRSEKEDSDSNVNDEDFRPKTYQMIKQEPLDNGTPRLRILPRRSLKGKRTTGFLVDSEFVLSKNQIKTEPEEIEEVHVVIEKKEATPVKRKRGRPQKIKENNKNVIVEKENPKRQKLFQREIKEKDKKEGTDERETTAKGGSHDNQNLKTDLNIKESTESDIKNITESAKSNELKNGIEKDGITEMFIFDNDTAKGTCDFTAQGVSENSKITVTGAITQNEPNNKQTTESSEVVTSSVNEITFDESGIISAQFSLNELEASTEKTEVENLADNFINSSIIDSAYQSDDLNQINVGETEMVVANADNVLVENTARNESEVHSEVECKTESAANVKNSTERHETNINFSSDTDDNRARDENRAEDENGLGDNNGTGDEIGTGDDNAVGGSLTESEMDNNPLEEKHSEDTNKAGGKFEKRKRKRKSMPIPMAIRETDNGKEYICTICNKKFNTERYLRLHAPMHTNEFKCKLCDKTFARKESMQKHECRIPAKIIQEEITVPDELQSRTNYRCSNCNASFQNVEEAERHLRTHARGIECEHCGTFFLKRVQFSQHICPNLEDSRYSCDICDQTFKSEPSLFRHMAMHTDLYKCEVCEKCYSRKDSLIRHVTKCCPEKAEQYGVFSCKKCSKTFGTKLGLENHEANCKMHKCESCHKVFDSERHLTEHNCNPLPENCDLKSKRVKFSCTECNKSFRNLHYLNQHKKVHCNSHECKFCSKKLKSMEEWEDHERFCLAINRIKHDGKIGCDRCDLEFFLAKEYKEHYQTHTHMYHCEICDKRFVKIGSLHTHQCIPADGLKCNYCKREFKSLKLHHNHMMSHSDFLTHCPKCNQFFELEAFNEHDCDAEDVPEETDESAKYVCHVCGKNFVSTSNLNKHIKVHGEKNISCKYCGKKFHYPEYLKVHIEGVHEKKNQFQCSDCGKILTSKPGLVSHTKLFHSANKAVWPCPECGKCFSQKGNMKTHMYSHAKERAFQCSECPKTFKYPDQLNRHKLSHSEGNKFQCDVCEKIFVKDYELKKHLQSNHSNKMYVCEFCDSRCGHRHTIIRHYKRKHPAQAQLVESPQYLDSLYQEVDLDAGKSEILTMKHTAQIQQPNGETITVPIDEMISHSAAEALSSLSTLGNQQTIEASDVAHLISQNGTLIQIAGQENMFTLPTNQDGDDNQQTVVILQIVNPQEQQIEVTELETHVVDTAEIETISQDENEVTDFQYTENILSTS